MTRTIKFRGRRVDTKRWVYGDYFKTPLTDENSGTQPDSGWFFLTGQTRHCIGSNVSAFVIDPSTVGQFIGLKDKNGQDVYDGDFDDTDSVIGFDEVQLCWVSVWKRSYQEWIDT